VKITILTPDQGDPLFGTMWQPTFEIYRNALLRLGADVASTPWTQMPPADTDVVTPLLAWGYHAKEVEWRCALDRISRSFPMVNSADVIQWNLTKRYLAELTSLGIATVPTLFGDRLTSPTIAEAIERFGTSDLVAKPQLSAAGDGIVRLDGDANPPEMERPMMLQPFLPSIEIHGEVSVIILDGHCRFAARKKPAEGGFLVQPQYGGTMSAIQVPDRHRLFAENLVARLPFRLDYARVDIIQGLDGSLLLAELELIEPDLYLAQSPENAHHFAQALLSGVERQLSYCK
jgi:hypothetical protein